MKIVLVLFIAAFSLVASGSVQANDHLATKGSEHNLSINEKNVTQPVETYKWIKDNRPNSYLKTLIATIKNDHTLLCPQKVDLNPLLAAIDNMKTMPVKDNKDRVEQLASDLLKRYIDIRNRGCYSPRRFFSKDELAYPGKKPKDHIIENPIEKRLEQALRKYRGLAKEGGWKKIEVKDVAYLRPGNDYPIIPALKERLKIEGFYKGTIDQNTTYDEGLKKAVIAFQKSHGLKPDGVVGPATLDALNIPVEAKIQKILLNIERIRWFKQDDPYFVFVDIPGFFLKVFDNNRSVFGCKVVVGRKKRPTPIMRDRIAYAVLNPYWRAPKTIIKEDILPQFKSGNFDRLRKEGIMASMDYQGKNVVNFEDIDWTQYDETNVPFYFFQQPGPHNFLGYLKLIFPNRFDVYLHDTNHRNLFKYTYRALSSGCVRLQKPIELFYLLKKREREITCRDIFDIIWSKRTKKIGFKQKIPVYLSYNSVYVDDNGTIYFFDDVYKYDKRMMKIFKQNKSLLEARW